MYFLDFNFVFADLSDLFPTTIKPIVESTTRDSKSITNIPTTSTTATSTSEPSFNCCKSRMEYSERGFIQDFFILSDTAQKNTTIRESCPDRCVYVKYVFS